MRGKWARAAIATGFRSISLVRIPQPENKRMCRHCFNNLIQLHHRQAVILAVPDDQFIDLEFPEFIEGRFGEHTPYFRFVISIDGDPNRLNLHAHHIVFNHLLVDQFIDVFPVRRDHVHRGFVPGKSHGDKIFLHDVFLTGSTSP